MDLELQLVQKFEKRDMPHLDWLDRMTFKEIEKIHAVSIIRGLFFLAKLTSCGQDRIGQVAAPVPLYRPPQI